MNIVEVARRGYAGHARQTQSARTTEYAILAKVSHRLRKAALDRRDNYAEFVAALSENRKLWTTFAVDVAREDNALPASLRARLFWLAEFTECETRRVLKGGGDVAALLEINAALLQGLRTGDVAS